MMMLQKQVCPEQKRKKGRKIRNRHTRVLRGPDGSGPDLDDDSASDLSKGSIGSSGDGSRVRSPVRSDPDHFGPRSSSIRSGWIRARSGPQSGPVPDPVRSGPIRPDPVRSGPVRSGPRSSLIRPPIRYHPPPPPFVPAPRSGPIRPPNRSDSVRSGLRSSPRSGPVRSCPVRSGPVRSCPRSGPIRSDPPPGVSSPCP